MFIPLSTGAQNVEIQEMWKLQSKVKWHVFYAPRRTCQCHRQPRLLRLCYQNSHHDVQHTCLCISVHAFYSYICLWSSPLYIDTLSALEQSQGQADSPLLLQKSALQILPSPIFYSQCTVLILGHPEFSLVESPIDVVLSGIQCGWNILNFYAGCAPQYFILIRNESKVSVFLPPYNSTRIFASVHFISSRVEQSNKCSRSFANDEFDIAFLSGSLLPIPYNTEVVLQPLMAWMIGNRQQTLSPRDFHKALISHSLTFVFLSGFTALSDQNISLFIQVFFSMVAKQHQKVSIFANDMSSTFSCALHFC